MAMIEPIFARAFFPEWELSPTRACRRTAITDLKALSAGTRSSKESLPTAGSPVLTVAPLERIEKPKNLSFKSKKTEKNQAIVMNP
jgi:hypothetical protein